MKWRNSLGHPGMTIREAIKAIDEGAVQICLIVDENDCLMATVTDGDIRRAILAGHDVDASVDSIMNCDPITAAHGDSQDEILALMRSTHVRQLPVVDSTGRIVELALHGLVDDVATDRDNLVVLMVGGLGTRLRPLTDDRPKPLLPVGNKPLLQTILEGFVSQGFSRFRMCVNYKSEMIMEHFGDGAQWGVEIRYLEEGAQSGTIGGIRFLDEQPTSPILVMNGDLLTKIDYQHLLDFHHQNAAAATMCVREYEWQVPFGVVELDLDTVTSIVEKPVHREFINAGIYVLDPTLLRLVPDEGAYDMTTLFETVIQQGKNVVAFPIREYWLDVGYANDLARANGDFDEIFGE